MTKKLGHLLLLIGTGAASLGCIAALTIIGAVFGAISVMIGFVCIVSGALIIFTFLGEHRISPVGNVF